MLKTIKIEESTHKILKWLQSQEILMDEKHHDQDAVIFKSLVTYAKCRNYNLLALRKLVEDTDEK